MYIVTEGETDEEFYRLLLEQIKQNTGHKMFPFAQIDYVCARGIGKFETKMFNKIKNWWTSSDLINKSEKIIVLCYDLDVFEYQQKPALNREQFVQKINELGPCRIIKIEAKNTIEDFFMFDFEGIRKYLRLPANYKQKEKGLLGLNKMFKDARKTYFKGAKIEGFIKSLDFDLILSGIESQISELYDLFKQ